MWKTRALTRPVPTVLAALLVLGATPANLAVSDAADRGREPEIRALAPDPTWYEPGRPVPMPEVQPRKPGPIPIPTVEPVRPGPVPMPHVRQPERRFVLVPGPAPAPRR